MSASRELVIRHLTHVMHEAYMCDNMTDAKNIHTFLGTIEDMTNLAYQEYAELLEASDCAAV